MQGTEAEDVGLEAALELLRLKALRGPRRGSRQKQPASPKAAPDPHPAAPKRAAAQKAKAPAKAKVPSARAEAAAKPRVKAAPRAAADVPTAAKATRRSAAADVPTAAKAKRRSATAVAGKAKGTEGAGTAVGGGTEGAGVAVGGGPEGAGRAAGGGIGAGRRRPLSAYLRFCAQERAVLRAEQPGLRPPDVRAPVKGPPPPHPACAHLRICAQKRVRYSLTCGLLAFSAYLRRSTK